MVSRDGAVAGKGRGAGLFVVEGTAFFCSTAYEQIFGVIKVLLRQTQEVQQICLKNLEKPFQQKSFFFVERFLLKTVKAVIHALYCFYC